MNRGFTLIEMSVVLLVIAIVTHLAMRELSSRMDDRKAAAADRLLEEIRGGVYALDRDGVPAGFLADMGRLVSATNGTLAELWRKPVGARAYAVREAVKENLAAGAPTALAEAEVFVPTGWRGPYLRLPVGKDRLRDPWGNAMENPDDAGYSRLTVSNGLAAAVSHFGPTALANDARRRTLALAPERWSATRLFVSVVSRSGESRTDPVEYKWFGPEDGYITGAVTNAAFGTTAVFSGLTPGVRVVYAKIDAVTRLRRQVKIAPGDNLLQFEIP